MGRETVDKHMDKKSNSFAESANGPSSDDKNVQLPSAEVKECTDHQNTNDTPDSKKKLNSSSSSLKTRASSTSPTVPKPFSLSAEKPASSVSPGNAASHNSSPASRGSQPNSPLPARKTTADHTKHHDEEDCFSVASSSATSTRTIKPKLTVGVAPTFRSSARLERRKEFYQKLEEKQKALEEEKRENEKRLKEEQELVTKQLRKNMAYKANPVPNFYYEAPPPKTPLKKFPLTRPKSPNLNRRKSCSSTVNSSYQEVKGKHCDRHRHSVDGCKEEPKTSNGARSPNMTRKFTKETSKSEEVNGKNKVRQDGEKSENGA